MPIKMAVFDMAGTTVWDGDNAVARCVCDALRAAGADVSEADVDPVMGMPKPQAVRMLLEQARGAAPSASEVTAVHADFQARAIEHYRAGPGVRELDGATDAFEALRRHGVRVTLDTGFDRTILDAIVARLGWHTLLDDTIASDEVAHGRPAPDLILALMERAGLTDPAEVAKIGDSVSDIEQGLNNRCGLVAAMQGDRTRPVMHRFPGVHAVESLAEFLDLVLAHDGVGV